MVIAHNEETGVSGVFPVSAVMSRQAVDLIWITLENNTGEITRMGITSEHPLFAVGEGWLDASEIVAGDRVRDTELRELTVVAVEADTRPQIVHNLEIAKAHTYFAGELEAWGHNAGKTATDLFNEAGPNPTCGCGCGRRVSHPKNNDASAGTREHLILPQAAGKLVGVPPRILDADFNIALWRRDCNSRRANEAKKFKDSLKDIIDGQF